MYKLQGYAFESCNLYVFRFYKLRYFFAFVVDVHLVEKSFLLVEGSVIGDEALYLTRKDFIPNLFWFTFSFQFSFSIGFSFS